MRKRVIAMVLVGGRGTRLGAITKDIAKPAVPFGAKYKLIDFVLSNLTNSNITTCGIVTQYEPLELMTYIGHGSTWDLDVNEGGVSFLTPYASVEGHFWQRGTAHAIFQHYKYIEQYDPDHVLILSGDHIYKMDYRKMIDEHIKNSADITISAFSVYKDASRFGIIESDDNNRIVGFEEKPEKPKSNQASMGIYVFKKSVLKELLHRAQEGKYDFGHDVIPSALKEGYKLFVYKFKGYFQDVGTIESLYRTNMDLIDNPAYLKLHEYVDFPIYTKSGNYPPHHISKNGKCVNSLISDGCLIYGYVNHSLVSSGVLISEQSAVIDSIIHQNAQIAENCYLKNVILVKETFVKKGTRLSFDVPTVVSQEDLEGSDDHA